MKMMKALLVTLALSAGTAQAATNMEIIQHVSHNVILATYQDLAQTSATLAAVVEDLEKNPTQENLDKAQAAWRAARIPWESSEAFLFGPVDSLGIDPMIDTWPLNKLDLDRVMASPRELTVEFVRALGTNLQGFHTLEYILFGNGQTSNTRAASTLTKKELEYAKASSVLLAEYTAKLTYAWTNNYDPEIPTAPGYINMISQPGDSNHFYSTERAVMEELIQGMMGILDEVANGKMSDPLGANIGSANMALVESPFSWNSLNDFTNNIRSVYSIYTGHYRQNQGPGVRDLVARVDANLAAKVEQDILNAMQLIQAIRPAGGGDFGQAIFQPDGRQRTQAAIDALNELRNLMDSEVLPTIDQ